MRAQIQLKGCVNLKINRKEVTFWRGGGGKNGPAQSFPTFI